jgi:hypothetical protein
MFLLWRKRKRKNKMFRGPGRSPGGWDGLTVFLLVFRYLTVFRDISTVLTVF